MNMWTFFDNEKIEPFQMKINSFFVLKNYMNPEAISYMLMNLENMYLSTIIQNMQIESKNLMRYI